MLRGDAVFELDGNELDAPAGTLVFVPPAFPGVPSNRTMVVPSSVAEAVRLVWYEARGWELWAPLAPLYQAGEYAEVTDRLSVVVAAAPQYPMLFFNLACCESLSGRTSDALDHLRHAIETSAKNDSDLDPIRD